MTRCAPDDVLFRVAGGPRVGFGHLLRSLALARALGVRPHLSLRGSARTGSAARALGALLSACRSPRQLDPRHTRILVVDDPSVRAADPWVRTARARGIRSVSVHDLGLAPLASDLAIDGSVSPGRYASARQSLVGTRYTVLHPELAALRARRSRRMRRAAGPKTTAPRVVVSLGGGVRAPLALRLAGAVLAAAPQADVIVAAGFAAPALAGRHACRTIAPATFTRELASATAAVLAGGVSLYEACALRVPTVGVSVVRSQRPTVRELGRRGAVIDAGHLDRAGDVERVARRVAGAVARLLAGPARRRALSRRAGAEIDGLGARRVAAAIHALGRGPAEAAAASRA